MKIGKKSYYKRKLDTYWSKYIRSGGFCQRCGEKNKRLEMAHIISRNNQTLRYNEDNLLCLCTTCHFWAHQDPLGFADFVKKDFPSRYKYLMKMKGKITKRSAKDLKELLEELNVKKSKDLETTR